MRINSNIYKDPEDEHLIDFTYLGTILKENTKVRITQENHFFQVGDAIAYDPEQKKFVRALAANSIQSEVCGVVSETIDLDDFILVNKGQINTPQYKYPDGSILWLSEVVPGKLVSIQPTRIFKKIGIQISPGIIEVNLNMGFVYGDNSPEPDSLEPYTKEELDEIIVNIW